MIGFRGSLESLLKLFQALADFSHARLGGTGSSPKAGPTWLSLPVNLCGSNHSRPHAGQARLIPKTAFTEPRPSKPSQRPKCDSSNTSLVAFSRLNTRLHHMTILDSAGDLHLLQSWAFKALPVGEEKERIALPPLCSSQNAGADRAPFSRALSSADAMPWTRSGIWGARFCVSPRSLDKSYS